MLHLLASLYHRLTPLWNRNIMSFERVFDAYVMFTIINKLEIKIRPSTFLKISEPLA